MRKQNTEVIKLGKMSIVTKEKGSSKYEPFTYIKTALKVNYSHTAKYFPDTKKGLKWAMAYFDFLEKGGNAYGSQEFRDYLKENHIPE